jgi:rSAM/selenodomain-associated transferase 1
VAERVALGVMARAPSDARGKTRLIRALGLDDGADLRRAILLDTLEAIQPVRLADRVVLFTPADASREIAGLGADLTRLIPQRGETLGDRLENGFADLFALGYDAAALIGSDLPTLPPRQIEEGLEALGGAADPLVLGPADDGGYYFIGLRRPHPELFRGVPWSTEGVLAATRAIAVGQALEVTLMRPWYDLDAVPDLERALRETDVSLHPSGGARHLRAWAAHHRLSSPAVSRLLAGRPSKDGA